MVKLHTIFDKFFFYDILWSTANLARLKYYVICTPDGISYISPETTD